MGRECHCFARACPLGAEGLRVEFDRQCSTERRHDPLTVMDSVSRIVSVRSGAQGGGAGRPRAPRCDSCLWHLGQAAVWLQSAGGLSCLFLGPTGCAPHHRWAGLRMTGVGAARVGAQAFWEAQSPRR